MYQPMTINGTVMSFTHLVPIKRTVTLELKGGLRKDVPVEFNFSCHCFSRGLASGEVAPPGHEVPDGSVHMPRPRVFDAERYKLSLGLVGMIDQVIAQNSIVTRTRQENFFRVSKVPIVRAEVKQDLDYFVFFHARKLTEPNRPKSLLVWIESAYPEQDGIPHPSGKGSRTFGAMLGEHWQSPKG